MDDQILNILSVCRKGSRALGPGLRYVIWTQGCPFHCKGCITPEGQPIVERMLVDVELTAADIISRHEIDGITISGGEPFLQVPALTRLLKLVKKERPEITVIVFTGFKIEAIIGSPAETFLSEIDVLIDGAFDEECKISKGLRGSSNQGIHYISNRLLLYEDELENGDRIYETKISNDSIVTIGIPK